MLYSIYNANNKIGEDTILAYRVGIKCLFIFNDLLP